MIDEDNGASELARTEWTRVSPIDDECTSRTVDLESTADRLAVRHSASF